MTGPAHPGYTNGTRTAVKALRGETAGVRRVRYAARALVIGAAVTACCGFAIALSDQFTAQIDATATREHQLSEHTRRVLSALDQP